MIKTGMNVEAGIADAELVIQTRDGNRDAFEQIVSRYQSLVCALAYSATGSLGQSEDLAQETFITAWKHLRHLREPGKLRAWLCGIARNRINNCLRREGHGPLHAAESLEAVAESPSALPWPSEQAISKEEAAILWRCIQHIPDTYREPLVLFYREGESVEHVAVALGLSEDAVKQRLSRGRKLVHGRVLAMVAGTLRQTVPGKTFTLGVMAGVPLLATTTKAATAGAAVKGSSSAKIVIGVATVGTILLYYSLIAFLAFMGGCAGYGMSRACVRSFRQCENAVRFWRALTISFAACLAVWLLIQPLLFSLDLVRRFTLTQYGGGWKLWTDLFCTLALSSLALWIRRWWRDLSRQDVVVDDSTRLSKKRFVFWLTLGMIGPACLSILFLWFMYCVTAGPAAERRLSFDELQEIVTQRKDARFAVFREMDGAKDLHIALPEDGGRFLSRAVFNEAALKLLEENSVDYTTIKTYSQEAWPFGFLLPIFIACMGMVILVRQIGEVQRETPAPGTDKTLGQQNSRYGRILLLVRNDSMTRRVFGIAFATVFLLVFGANALTGTGLYVVGFVGVVKGAFLGLVSAIGVLFLRAQRKAL
jgi:RNA polymerase sigma factor (sigma-70 family)